MSKPTKILRKPYKKLLPDSSGRPQRRLVVDTDAGTLLLSALAEELEIPYQTLRSRMGRSAKGWADPHILDPPNKHGYLMDGRPISSARAGNSEWRSLGRKERDQVYQSAVTE